MTQEGPATTDGLPASRWRSPDDVPAVLDLPAAGLLLGADARQAAIALPALGPRPIRLGVLGDHRIATLLAYRLLGVGCRLWVASEQPERWRGLLTAAEGRARIGPDHIGWPPPSRTPQLLVTDLPQAPPPGLGDRPMCTIVHVTPTVPAGSPYWSAVHAVVLAGQGHGTPLAELLGRPDAAGLDQLDPGQLGLLDAGRATVVTPILAEAELALLVGS